MIPEGIDCSVFFDEIKQKPKSNSTLLIKGIVSSGFKIKMSLEYSGSELIDNSNAMMPNEILTLLNEDLFEIFGNGPFDKKVLKQEIKNLNMLYYVRYNGKAYRSDEWDAMQPEDFAQIQ
ncbi:hypothetical protein [Paenibacillus sp. PL91]|uniref:hypothetical protein n=1 Tax=Paenibacillus sp. PL91 TaxID=2729538 RepID=UPI00145E81F7|nr:hypothetical protein [Paenibacillus sp. PL91]MBC9199620.1 hypothetical protein [Paenibacillus sp. PL91]